jgi:hypothetical protein
MNAFCDLNIGVFKVEPGGRGGRGNFGMWGKFVSISLEIRKSRVYVCTHSGDAERYHIINFK